jgi:glycosyltransferase involved in cell wall biosynthesis
MAGGRPVVLADAPGARELAGDGDENGGVLVPRGSAPQLADALLTLLLAPARRDRLGRAARRRVEREFSIAAVGRQLGAALTAAGVHPVVAARPTRRRYRRRRFRTAKISADAADHAG